MASVFSPLLLAVWAIGGGALSRMSAMFVARGERATVRTAVEGRLAERQHVATPFGGDEVPLDGVGPGFGRARRPGQDDQRQYGDDDAHDPAHGSEDGTA